MIKLFVLHKKAKHQIEYFTSPNGRFVKLTSTIDGKVEIIKETEYEKL